MSVPLSEKEKLIVYFLRLTTSIISTIGILFLFIFFITQKMTKVNKESSPADENKIPAQQRKENENRNKFAHNMIFAIAFATLINCIATFLYTTPFNTIESNTIETYLCITQAFLYAFSEIATVFLATALSFFNFWMFYCRKEFKYPLLYFIYGIGIPLLFSIICLPGFINIYGQAGPWCWISSQNGGNPSLVPIITMFIIIICWINLAANIFFMVKVYIFSRKDKNSISRELMYYLLVYSFTLAVCRIPGTINRIVELIVEREVFGLFVITSISISSIGFFISLVYLLSVFKQINNKNNVEDNKANNNVNDNNQNEQLIIENSQLLFPNQEPNNDICSEISKVIGKDENDE